MRGGAAVTMAHLGTQEITITIAAAGIAAAIDGPLGAATTIPTPGGSHPLAIIQQIKSRKLVDGVIVLTVGQIASRMGRAAAI
jgi:phosphoribosylcarboxyaminoimidazole (NCAIR) mutase